jgi:hypothetical protein
MGQRIQCQPALPFGRRVAEFIRRKPVAHLMYYDRKYKHNYLNGNTVYIQIIRLSKKIFQLL